jgi:hypothetical protein
VIFFLALAVQVVQVDHWRAVPVDRLPADHWLVVRADHLPEVPVDRLPVDLQRADRATDCDTPEGTFE